MQVSDRPRASGPDAALGQPPIRLRNITKNFSGGKDQPAAIVNLNLDIYDKELLVLLGPSGCGKSTTLNILAGLEEPTSGEVWFGDELMNDVPTEERDISMVFQSIALYPHLNVQENVTFALKHRKVPKEEQERRLGTVIPMLGMEPYMRRKLHQLSGGERQRVAIAKALVKRPRLFLLDEPFSSLDADMRRQLRGELVQIHRALGTTMVFVTHDQEEAMSVADRIVVMRKGELTQVGTPLDIYMRPANVWTSKFIGTHPINMFEVMIDPSAPSVSLPGRTDVTMRLDPGLHARLRAAAPSGSVMVGIRPEFVKLSPAGDANASEWRGEVYTRQVLGTTILYDVRSGADRVTAVTDSDEQFAPGDAVSVAMQWPRAFFFDKQTEERLEA